MRIVCVVYHTETCLVLDDQNVYGAFMKYDPDNGAMKEKWKEAKAKMKAQKKKDETPQEQKSDDETPCMLSMHFDTSPQNPAPTTWEYVTAKPST